MKTKIFIQLIFCLTLVLNNNNFLIAQESAKGTLKGKVVAADDKMGLPFANVLVDGTTNGTATNMDGSFIIRNVDAGTQKIKVTYVGYQTKIEEVVIKANTTTEVEFVLSISDVVTYEVVITAQAKGQREAINQQINSSTIVDIVAPDRIRQNPDANSAEAIGRLPGISLIRSGGEGVGLVIRGLDPKYSTVSLNGIVLPSTSYTDRETSVSGISQYLLEGVSVYKSITADMDGNSVAGAINLTLAPAPEEFKYSFIAQTGYNRLNDYLGNYKFQGDVSGRLLDGLLGARFSFNAERVNRSRQTMSAGYTVSSNLYQGLAYEPVYLSNATLNDIYQLNEKQAATLVLDLEFSPTSKILLYNFFSVSGGDYTSASKSYNPLSATIFYNISQQNARQNLLYSSSLRGDHSFDWFDVDYGVAYSQTHNYVPNERTWQFWLSNAFNEEYRDTSVTRSSTPNQVINLSNDNSEEGTLKKITLFNMGSNNNDMIQKDLSLYFDLKSHFKLSDDISGYVKGGGKYKYVSRIVDFMSATQFAATNPYMGGIVKETHSWLQQTSWNINAVPFYDHILNDFLDGEYNFGWYPNLERLNQMWDAWNNFSNDLMNQGVEEVINKVGAMTRIGFVPDYYGSSIRNQDLKEKYWAAYLMSEVNFSSLIMFVPGVRYEKVVDDMLGNFVYDLSQAYTLTFPRTYVSATRKDEYWLPMIQMKIKPVNWFHIHASFTKTLGRPSYDQIVPNTYVNNGLQPYIYQSGNPGLKPEQWTSYDLQFAFFGNEVGLFSVGGFYKEAKDKIWYRVYNRIKGDPLVPGFPDNAQVTVIETVNNIYPAYVKGLEFSWQTSFWYLPEPLNYFALNVNYSLMKSETKYPTTRMYTSYVIGPNGRPIATLHRVDSVATERMINQPNSIANVSLGFNYEGLNVWLSYQYNGSILTSWSAQRELIGTQGSYRKWDLQISQELPVDGLSLLFNVANINNAEQDSKLKGDPRFTYTEQYGWTSDLGLRYEF